jgi:hypothetical protein
MASCVLPGVRIGGPTSPLADRASTAPEAREFFAVTGRCQTEK